MRSSGFLAGGQLSWKGHNIDELYNALASIKQETSQKPRVIIANTVKGKGVPRLEKDSLCHIKALSIEEIEQLLAETN